MNNKGNYIFKLIWLCRVILRDRHVECDWLISNQSSLSTARVLILQFFHILLYILVHMYILYMCEGVYCHYGQLYNVYYTIITPPSSSPLISNSAKEKIHWNFWWLQNSTKNIVKRHIISLNWQYTSVHSIYTSLTK